MIQSKTPRVSVIVPGPDHGVAVRVTPPDSRLQVLVRAKDDCLEVRITPQGFQVEVEILPAEATGHVDGKLFVSAFETQGEPGSGLQAAPLSPASSHLSMEPVEVTFYRSMMEAADTALVSQLEAAEVPEPVLDAPEPPEEAPELVLDASEPPEEAPELVLDASELAARVPATLEPPEGAPGPDLEAAQDLEDAGDSEAMEAAPDTSGEALEEDSEAPPRDLASPPCLAPVSAPAQEGPFADESFIEPLVDLRPQDSEELDLGSQDLVSQELGTQDIASLEIGTQDSTSLESESADLADQEPDFRDSQLIGAEEPDASDDSVSPEGAARPQPGSPSLSEPLLSEPFLGAPSLSEPGVSVRAVDYPRAPALAPMVTPDELGAGWIGPSLRERPMVTAIPDPLAEADVEAPQGDASASLLPAKRLDAISRTQALLAQLPDLEQGPKPRADDDSRSSTDHLERAPILDESFFCEPVSEGSWKALHDEGGDQGERSRAEELEVPGDLADSEVAGESRVHAEDAGVDGELAEDSSQSDSLSGIQNASDTESDHLAERLSDSVSPEEKDLALKFFTGADYAFLSGESSVTPNLEDISLDDQNSEEPHLEPQGAEDLSLAEQGAEEEAVEAQGSGALGLEDSSETGPVDLAKEASEESSGVSSLEAAEAAPKLATGLVSAPGETAPPASGDSVLEALDTAGIPVTDDSDALDLESDMDSQAASELLSDAGDARVGESLSAEPAAVGLPVSDPSQPELIASDLASSDLADSALAESDPSDPDLSDPDLDLALHDGPLGHGPMGLEDFERAALGGAVAAGVLDEPIEQESIEQEPIAQEPTAQEPIVEEPLLEAPDSSHSAQAEQAQEGSQEGLQEGLQEELQEGEPEESPEALEHADPAFADSASPELPQADEPLDAAQDLSGPEEDLPDWQNLAQPPDLAGSGESRRGALSFSEETKPSWDTGENDDTPLVAKTAMDELEDETPAVFIRQPAKDDPNWRGDLAGPAYYVATAMRKSWFDSEDLDDKDYDPVNDPARKAAETAQADPFLVAASLAEPAQIDPSLLEPSALDPSLADSDQANPYLAELAPTDSSLADQFLADPALAAPSSSQEAEYQAERHEEADQPNDPLSEQVLAPQGAIPQDVAHEGLAPQDMPREDMALEDIAAEEFPNVDFPNEDLVLDGAEYQDPQVLGPGQMEYESEPISGYQGEDQGERQGEGQVEYQPEGPEGYQATEYQGEELQGEELQGEEYQAEWQEEFQGEDQPEHQADGQADAQQEHQLDYQGQPERQARPQAEYQVQPGPSQERERAAHGYEKLSGPSDDTPKIGARHRFREMSPAPEWTGSILEPAVVAAPDGSNPSITPVLEPSLEPQVEIEPVLEPRAPHLKYTPPRPAPKAKFAAEASPAVIVNYLEDSDDNFLDVQDQKGELAEEDDMDIDLMDMHSHEPPRIAARPMIPVPKVPL